VEARIPAPIEMAPVADDSADDASLAYGFGAGHSDIDGVGHDESAAARAPRPHFEKAEEEFDGASTTSDWRRSAMSFEVSEEDARRPAFSGEDLEPAPLEAVGESVVEPIVESMPAIEPLHATIVDPTLEAEPAPLTEADLKAPDSWQLLPDDAAVHGEGDQHSEWASDVPDVPSIPHPVAVPESSMASHEETDGAVPEIVSRRVPEAVSEPKSAEPVHELAASSATPEPTPVESVAPVTPAAQPSVAAKASHWMDAMGSVSAQPQSDWLSIIHSQQQRTLQNGELVTVPPAAAVAEIPARKPVEEALASTVSSLAPEAAAATLTAINTGKDAGKDTAQAVSSAPSQQQVVPQVTQQVAQHDDESVSQEDEDWFFADDEPQPAAPGETASSAVSSSGEPVTVEAAAIEPASSEPTKEAAAPQHIAFEATVAEPVAVSPAREDTEFVEQEVTAPAASRDSELIEPPPVRVTPEPLLVDEYSPKASDHRYVDRQQDIAPAYTFLPPVETKADAASSAPEPAGAHARQEESVLPSFGDRLVSPDGAQSSALKPEEDTVPSYLPPSPTREQIAHIPFLNPPPDVPKQAEKVADNGVAQFAVDAVVQRILDKIEPQLHDLLAQNLRPLIENLVHAEMQKHEQ
jgi:hypothetical protein